MADYEIDILVNGKPLRQFQHKGDFFIEGRKGSNFELKFTNNTWKRIEVVPSVDGLNVIDGEECGIESSGYVVNSRDSITIPGWRLDNDKVAEFIFKDKKKSYAKRTGKGTSNVGAIGFMVFAEKEYLYIPPINPSPPLWPNPNPTTPWQPYNPYITWTTNTIIGSGNVRNTTDNKTSINIQTEADIKLGSSSKSTTKTSADSASLSSYNVSTSLDSLGSNRAFTSDSVEIFNIGVGFGDEQDHSVHEIDFQRDNTDYPTDTLVIYYDSRKGLENRGIRVVKTKKKKTWRLPDPFPTYSSTNVGCKPPPNWNRKR